MESGDKVLIHAASGGVGLAAIQMAQQHGATVFATASTYKRDTLRRLGVQHVHDSRTTDFADQILTDTAGAGVDVVLNSLAGEGFIEATLRATAPGGRFAEIVALDTVMFTEPDRIRDLLTEVSDGLGGDQWVPLPAEIYPLTEARAAFRRMQQARHIGKIVLQIPKPLTPQPDRSYLITGRLGAIGLHMASHLGQLGAGDIVLTGRRAPDAAAEQAIGEITDRHRCASTCSAPTSATRPRSPRRWTGFVPSSPRWRGVAHLAGVLDDALLGQQDVERFRTTLIPKAFGAQHLDRLTGDDDLDFFIVSSSVSSVFDSPGQANYSAANALLDGLVAHRRAQGLPATVINANWQRGAKLLGASRPPILDLVLPRAAGEIIGDSELLKQLQEIPVPQRAAFVTEFLQQEMQHFLRLAQPPAATSRFLDLGTDSLMAIELRNRLHSQFGGAFTINATAVFDYPTIGRTRRISVWSAAGCARVGRPGLPAGTGRRTGPRIGGALSRPTAPR